METAAHAAPARGAAYRRVRDPSALRAALPQAARLRAPGSPRPAAPAPALPESRGSGQALPPAPRCPPRHAAAPSSGPAHRGRPVARPGKAAACPRAEGGAARGAPARSGGPRRPARGVPGAAGGCPRSAQPCPPPPRACGHPAPLAAVSAAAVAAGEAPCPLLLGDVRAGFCTLSPGLPHGLEELLLLLRCLLSAPVLISLRWHGGGGGGGGGGEHLIIVMVAGGAAASKAEQSVRLYQLGVLQRLQSSTFFPARPGLFMCLLPPARGFAI